MEERRVGPGEQPVEPQVQRRPDPILAGPPRPGERGRQVGLLGGDVGGPVAEPARFDEHDLRGRSEEVGEQVLVVGEPREPGLHAVEQQPVGEALPLLPAPRLGGDELGRPLPDVLGRQQLPGGEDAHLFEVDRRALVGDGELAQPVDLVAPEVDAHGAVGRDGEDVDDRAAHRHLAAVLDLVLPPVPHGDEGAEEVVAVALLAGPHDDRLDVVDVRTEALHERPHRRHDDARVPPRGATAR